jgi:predicted DNA-binding transcriptional regulator YafY
MVERVMPAESSPTARALVTLDLLQQSPGITAEALAVRLGVTDRAARRYVAILREAGIPVASSPGRYGGYRLGRGMRPPPLVFSAPEALGLVMAVLDGQHAAADPQDPVGSALGKLIRALPDGVARPAATMREHALAVPDRFASRPDPEITTELVSAVATSRQVRLTYRSAAAAQWDDVVDPWAVLVRYGRWYLLCRAHRSDAIRTFRVDRVRSVELLAEPFDPPEDLDPVRLLEQHLAVGWRYPTRVVFDAPYAKVAPFVAAPMGHLEPLDDGVRCLLVGSTNDAADYAGERLAAVPFPFRVEGGPELREAVSMLSRRFAAAVADEVTIEAVDDTPARPG